MAVPVSTQPTFSHGDPFPLFKLGSESYDVSADGQRILVVEPAGTPKEPAIHIVENWYEEPPTARRTKSFLYNHL